MPISKVIGRLARLERFKEQMPMPPEFGYVWFWRKRLPERKGHLCAVTGRGAMNSIRVEFEDGFQVIASRYAVRRVCER